VFLSKKHSISTQSFYQYLTGKTRSEKIESILIQAGVPQEVIDRHFLTILNAPKKPTKSKNLTAYNLYRDEILHLSNIGLSIRAIWIFINEKIESDSRGSYPGFYKWFIKNITPLKK